MKLELRLLRDNFKKWVWKFLLEKMNFNWSLRSGIGVVVRNHGDWVIYNEIFVNGEYKEAIDETLDWIEKKGKKRVTVLDLGGNVGYFSLQFFDALFSRLGDFHHPRLLIVEADDRCIPELQERLLELEKKKVEVDIVKGLVGEKEGRAKFVGGKETFAGSVESNFLQKKGRSDPTEISYVDLDEYVDEKSEIDILKCDIEGSEFDFIKNYEPLLKRTKVLAIEFHDKIKKADAEKKLTELGFGPEHLLCDHPKFPTSFYVNLKG